MSFSSDVKAELCRAEISSRTALPECYGVLEFCNRFARDEARVVTGSDAFAARLPRLFKRGAGIAFDELPEKGESGKRTFAITSPESMARIIDLLGYAPRGLLTHHVNLGLLEDDQSRAAFLRGAFLAGGSVTDPKKGYHLEFVTGHYSVCRELTALFLDMGFEPRSSSRAGNYMTYFKKSDTIEDLLTTIGAPVSAMGIMSAKIEKDMTNQVNRKVNCDTANVTKTVEASAAQLADIKRLRDAGIFDDLTEKLREAARLREEYPELSIAELAVLAEPPVTKSGLSHRLRKISEIAQKIG